MTQEDWDDFKGNIYKYNIDTKGIEQINVQMNYEYSSVNVKVEALIHLYPNLKQIILEKTKTYNFGDAYYSNGRIFFVTYYSSSSKGTSEYLYEYLPTKNKIKRPKHPLGML